MSEVEFTPVAAEVLQPLPASTRKVIRDFLDNDFDLWRAENDPEPLPDLPGTYWRVKPIADSPILVITERAEDHKFVVVAAIPDVPDALPIDPETVSIIVPSSTAALGAEVLKTAKTVY